MSYSLSISPFYQQPIIFNEAELEQLSKLRIIQKNLVHFQNFPDYLYDQSILLSQEYFGQYGVITKIVLASKMDKMTHKKTNSAYLTFETKEQAAYCILSVDSIKIGEHLVRAFFGTTKYCNHFLKNYHCFNEEKCMFLHYLADQSDIISENSKFGYSEHIKLAKKIIGFGSLQSKYYVMNYKTNFKHFLPSIKTIYYKEEIIAKSKNHRRQISNSSQRSTNYSRNNSNDSNANNSPCKNDDNSNLDEEDFFNNINNININNYINNTINIDENDLICKNNKQEGKSFKSISCYLDLYKPQKKSRFFNNEGKEIKNNEKNIPENLYVIINNLLKRYSFFNLFNKYEPVGKINDNLEINYCENLFKKTKDEEIKQIIDKAFD